MGRQRGLGLSLDPDPRAAGGRSLRGTQAPWDLLSVPPAWGSRKATTLGLLWTGEKGQRRRACAPYPTPGRLGAPQGRHLFGKSPLAESGGGVCDRKRKL